MRARSTVESVARGEPSLLAIVETILAMSVSIFLAIHYHTIIHLVLGALIAPFLFLRTKEITLRTIQWFEERRLTKYDKELLNLFSLVTTPLQCGLVKCYYTLSYFLADPKKMLGVIPKNWFSMSISMDLFHLPEMIPGAEACRDECDSDFYWNDYLDELQVWSADEIAKEPNRFWRYVIRFSNVISMLFNVLFFFGLSYVYRFFVKSISLIYWPLIWFVDPKKPTKDTVLQRKPTQANLEKPKIVHLRGKFTNRP